MRMNYKFSTFFWTPYTYIAINRFLNIWRLVHWDHSVKNSNVTAINYDKGKT